MGLTTSGKFSAMFASDQTVGGAAAVIGRAWRNQTLPAGSIAHSISSGTRNSRSNSIAPRASVSSCAGGFLAPVLEPGGASPRISAPFEQALTAVPGFTAPPTSLSPNPSQYSISIESEGQSEPAGARVNSPPENAGSICSQTI